MISQTVITDIMQENGKPECEKFTSSNLGRIAQHINYGATVEAVRDILLNEMGLTEEEAYLFYKAAEILAKEQSE